MRILIVFYLLLLISGLQAQDQTENVILITLDGLRWQELYQGADSDLIQNQQFVKDPEALYQEFWRDDYKERRKILMPFFWDVIAAKGQLHGNRQLNSKVNCTNQHWFSYPGYNEILCGYADDKRINSNDKLPNPNVTVLEVINQQPDFKGQVAAFGSWDVFPYIINEQRSGIPVNAGFEKVTGMLTDQQSFLNELQDEIPSPWPTTRHDAFTHNYAMDYLKNLTPRVLYIAYGETDDFAHDGHYDQYLWAAHRTDSFIKELWEFTQSHPQYRNKTIMIITTDHGRGTVPIDTWTSHGRKVEGAGEIWLAMLGPGIGAEGEVSGNEQLYQNQIAATIAKWLGIDYQSADSGPAITQK